MYKRILLLTSIVTGIFGGAYLMIALLMYTGRIDIPDIPKRSVESVGVLNTVFGTRAYVVQSGSMEPAIKTGGIIFVLPQENYVAGDIITFFPNISSKTLVTHRIEVKQFDNNDYNNPSYLTSGDANEDIDKWTLNNSQIVGKVAFTVPYLGYVVDFAKKPQGFILLVVVPVTIIIYEELKTIFRELRKGKKGFRGKKATKDTNNINFLKKEEDKTKLPKATMIIPITGAFFIVMASTGSYMNDLEKSIENIFQAAESFGQLSANIYSSSPYTCQDGAQDQEVQYGLIIFGRNNDTLDMNITLTGLLPNSSYDLWVNQYPEGCPLSSPSFSGGITTDSEGNYNEDFEIEIVENADTFWVSVVGHGLVLRSTSVNLP